MSGTGRERMRDSLRFVLLVLVLGLVAQAGGCKKDAAKADVAVDVTVDAPKTDLQPADAKKEVVPDDQVRSLKEMLGGKVGQKVRFVFDKAYEGEVDVDKLKEFVLSHELREADEFSTLTATEEWWKDYQDFVEILYYSAEHVFSDKAPYPGATFSPHIWKDIKYGVTEVTVEFMDLSEFYATIEERKRTETEPQGTEWTLLNANDGMAWAAEKFPHEPNEMVVVVTHNETYKDVPYSYYFVEEKYGKERGFDAHSFNIAMNQWPAEMQEEEGLKPHDLPIWMHFAFLNGEWDEASKSWRLFPGFRWGAYEDQNIYFIESIKDFYTPVKECGAGEKPDVPESHFYVDEQAYKECRTFTERLEYDWHRLWRHGFNTPSFPFWWSEKVDIRVVVVDLRDYADGVPEYEEEDVIDWQTVEDSVKEANPFADITIQRYNYSPPADIKQILIDNLMEEANYPMHSEVKLLDNGGEWHSFTMDWHYHFDISGLPGMQTYLAEKFGHYFGGVDDDGEPLQYHPFAEPYHRTGQPFVMPAIFFLTPHGSFNGTIGGWTTNTGDLLCIFAKQFGFSCDDLNQRIMETFGQPVGPNLNCWSDAYCMWWEVFVVDWTYNTSPVKTLRWFLDADPFEDLLGSIPDLGEFLVALAPGLFKELFGPFHPWASGFPFWLKESLTDEYAGDLSKQFASYQFAESIQHNIGYKHQTTVIFDCPYLGMEDGFNYRKHKDLNETYEMTEEQISMPFYSTEPGSRDFVIDANSYMTLKMGAGTRHMLQRIFARRQVMALYEYLTEIDPAYSLADDEYAAARVAYLEAAAHAVAWKHKEAHDRALEGLEHIDAYFAAQGKPDKLFTDWHSEVSFSPDKTGLDVTAEQLEKALKKIAGK